MTRRKRLKQCRIWRHFISDLRKAQNVTEARYILMGLDQIEAIQIEYGWTTWVTVRLIDGKIFVDNKFLPEDSLKEIGWRIYQYAAGQYLEYINQTQSQIK